MEHLNNSVTFLYCTVLHYVACFLLSQLLPCTVFSLSLSQLLVRLYCLDTLTTTPTVTVTVDWTE